MGINDPSEAVEGVRAAGVALGSLVLLDEDAVIRLERVRAELLDDFHCEVVERCVLRTAQTVGNDLAERVRLGQRGRHSHTRATSTGRTDGGNAYILVVAAITNDHVAVDREVGNAVDLDVCGSNPGG